MFSSGSPRHWQRGVAHRTKKSQKGVSGHRGAYHRRLQFEPLEDRRLLSVLGNLPGAAQHAVGVNGPAAAANTFAALAAPAVTGLSPASGPTAGGAQVTITGTGFTGATEVDFGGVKATGFQVNSATQITAASPAEFAGAVDVRVTTAGGTSTTSSADQFTYAARRRGRQLGRKSWTTASPASGPVPPAPGPPAPGSTAAP